MSDALYARYTDDLFTGATVSGTAPDTSYALATLVTSQPEARVRWAVDNGTITFTLASPARGDILVIPTSNLVGAILTLTNGAGLSVSITLPAIPGNRLPRTLAVDLTLLASAGTRTSNVWNLVIAANTANLIFGGAVALYGERRLLPYGMRRGFSFTKEQAVDLTENEYLVQYLVNHATNRVVIEGTIVVLNSQLADFTAWYDANAGMALPGLFWTGLSEIDAVYGLWDKQFKVKQLNDSNYYEITMRFTELSKGKSV